jgi:hypothetical protein
MNKLVQEYKYIVLEDEAKQIFVIRDMLLNQFLISGAYNGKTKELERGIFNYKQAEKENSYIGMLINKKKEWKSKRAIA